MAQIEDLTTGQWAIMVCLDGKDDWIYVTKDKGSCNWDLEPELFDDVSSALAFSEQFVIPGKEKNVLVVNYDGD